MEVRGGRRSREMSPDRVKVCTQHNNNNNNNSSRVIRSTFKKVQVVYYLSRNGQLEHPHFMEVTHLANQNLRLKDVTDRLTVLRGKGMPSMYSWSCKRSYKNGYVWNDLSENDIIYPSEGAEYILKGCEVIEGCTEKFQHLQLGNTQEMQTINFQQKRKTEIGKYHQEMRNNHYMKEAEVEDDNDDEDEYYEEKMSYSATPGHSRRSRGVSTTDIELEKCRENLKSPVIELTVDGSSPPSTASSTLSDKANESNNPSKRFEDGDPVGTEPLLSRNSMLFQLIACGGSLPFKAKNVAVAGTVKQQPPTTVARKSSCSDLHKGVLCKNAAVKVVVGEEVLEEDEIKCMSENPRFGNMHSEEKEYFSGSIVEDISNDERAAQVQPSLKKSSSYNEERSSKATLVEAAKLEDKVVEEPKRTEKTSMKGKCIPRSKRSSTKQIKK